MQNLRSERRKEREREKGKRTGNEIKRFTIFAAIFPLCKESFARGLYIPLASRHTLVGGRNVTQRITHISNKYELIIRICGFGNANFRFICVVSYPGVSLK